MSFTVSASATNGFDSVILKVYVLTGGTEAGGAFAVNDAFGVPTFDLTPNESGSYVTAGVYAASGGSTPALTPAAGNTTITGGNSSQGAYWAGYYSGTVTEGDAIALGCTDDSGWCALLGYEVIPSGGGSPALDASTPALVVGSDSGATTAAFTPPGSSVLVAHVLANGTATQVIGVTDTSGLGLTWTQRGTTHQNGFSGTAALFTTTVPGSGGVTAALAASLAGAAAAVSGSERISGALAASLAPAAVAAHATVKQNVAGALAPALAPPALRAGRRRRGNMLLFTGGL